MILGQRLLQKKLLDEATLQRACAEQARRRLFSLYDRLGAIVLLREGIHRLARFHATYVDVRPAIAYGCVVKAAPWRKREMSEKAANRRARLIAPYDESRNAWGLPPPALIAVRKLSNETVELEQKPCLPGLTQDTTAGLLLLLDRMSLLSLDGR
jgi:hypothetical protein